MGASLFLAISGAPKDALVYSFANFVPKFNSVAGLDSSGKVIHPTTLPKHQFGGDNILRTPKKLNGKSKVLHI
jgi:hypothetical protein